MYLETMYYLLIYQAPLKPRQRLSGRQDLFNLSER
jgi:hypothetical protein